MIKKFKEFINETLWGDMMDRSSGIVTRKEDIGATCVIDGIKYTFAKDFWNLGDEYEEENSNDWTCFAFNKTKNNFIEGNTEETGVFGEDKWDIGESPYDVYVLRQYIDHTKQELIQKTLDEGCIHFIERKEVEKLITKYLEDLFTNHMSDYSYYWIYDIRGNDKEYLPTIVVDSLIESIPDCVFDEFSPKNIILSYIIQYPIIENWSDKLADELTKAFEKEGFVKSETYEIDLDLIPNTEGLCFVKLK